MGYEDTPAGIYAQATRVASTIVKTINRDQADRLVSTANSRAALRSSEDQLEQELLALLAGLPFSGHSSLRRMLATLAATDPPAEPERGF